MAADAPADKRSTRGKKINFKDILDSGESDDDGNIHPKRRLVELLSAFATQSRSVLIY